MMWRSLVNESGTMSPELVRRVWAECERHDDLATLVRLAGRSDLPDDVEERVASFKKSPVRAARLCRPSFPSADLVRAIKAERADAALVEMAETTHRADAQSALWERYRQKPTRTLLYALAANPTLSSEVAANTLTELSDIALSMNDIPKRLARHVAGQLRNREDLRTAFARTVKRGGWAMPLVSTPGLDETGVRNLLAVVETHYDPRMRTHLLLALCSNPCAVRIVHDELRAVAEIESGGLRVDLLARIDRAMTQAVPQSAPDDHESRLACENDIQWLRKAAEDILQKTQYQQAGLVIQNPSLPDDLRGAICALLGLWDEKVRTIAISLANRDEQAFLPVVFAFPDVLRTSAISPKRLRSIARLAFRAMMEDHELHAKNESKVWTTVLQVAELETDELLALPWRIVRHADDDTRGRIAAWVADELADSTTAWDVLEGLDVSSMGVRESVLAVKGVMT